MAKTSRDEIIRVAYDLFRDHGYSGTSMKDLADRVGLLKGSLYSHFPSKEALVPEVLVFVAKQIKDGLSASGDWQSDYALALKRLVAIFGAHRRCVGLHFAYGLDETIVAPREAVKQFFSELHTWLVALLSQGLPADLADTFAQETLTRLEGATLWLALDANGDALAAAQAALSLQAQGYAFDLPDDATRKMLDDLVGDWRIASLAEKQLACRLAETEADYLMVRAALAGQIEAESCFL